MPQQLERAEPAVAGVLVELKIQQGSGPVRVGKPRELADGASYRNRYQPRPSCRDELNQSIDSDLEWELRLWSSVI